MLYTLFFIFISIALLGKGFFSPWSWKKRAVMILAGLLLIPAKMAIEMAYIDHQTSKLSDASKAVSSEQLESAISYYSDISSERVEKIRDQAIRIEGNPEDILRIATVISHHNGYIRGDRDALKEIFYVIKWFESGFKKYDDFFRGNEFERRRIRVNHDADNWIDAVVRSGERYYKSDHAISFGSYDFENKSFDVNFESALHYGPTPHQGEFIGSGFSSSEIDVINQESEKYKHVNFKSIPLSLFTDGKRRTDGAVRTGESIASTVFPDIDKSRLRVREEHAKYIDTEKLTLFVTAYFDADNSWLRLGRRTASLLCDFMDVYESEKMEKIVKTISCKDLNREVGRVSFY